MSVSSPPDARVLCVPRAKFDQLVNSGQGPFIPWVFPGEWAWHGMVRPGVAEFRPRAEVEEDPCWLQVIPYTILAYRGRVFGYRRSASGGDDRLRRRWSIGVGGHVDPSDYWPRSDDPDAWVMQAGKREIREELGDDSSDWPERLGLILDGSNPVGQVHLGLALLRETAGPIIPAAGAEIAERRVEPPARWLATEGLESWSRIVLEHLARRWPGDGVGGDGPGRADR